MAENRKERANQILNEIIEDFKKPDSLSRLAHVVVKGNIPCQRWSFLNQMAVMLSGTSDARGMKQWNNVGRRIRAGAKATWILAPCMITKRDASGNPIPLIDKRGRPVLDKDGKPKVVQILVGFTSVPVFKVEDTDGQPLEYQEAQRTPPPLIDVAQAWGIDVQWQPFNGAQYGSYNLNGRRIVLNSENAEVFFHELAHSAEHKLRGDKMKGGQDAGQEVVAEFCGAVLARLYGMKGREGVAYDYIKAYAERAGIDDPIKAISKVMGRVQKVLNLILGQDGKEATATA